MTEQEVTPEILGVLRSMDLFKGKDPDELVEWLGKAPFEGGAECALRQFAPGERITTEGNFGNSFFVLTRGNVNVTLGPEAQKSGHARPGQFLRRDDSDQRPPAKRQRHRPGTLPGH